MARPRRGRVEVEAEAEAGNPPAGDLSPRHPTHREASSIPIFMGLAIAIATYNGSLLKLAACLAMGIAVSAIVDIMRRAPEIRRVQTVAASWLVRCTLAAAVLMGGAWAVSTAVAGPKPTASSTPTTTPKISHSIHSEPATCEVSGVVYNTDTKLPLAEVVVGGIEPLKTTRSFTKFDTTNPQGRFSGSCTQIRRPFYIALRYQGWYECVLATATLVRTPRTPQLHLWASGHGYSDAGQILCNSRWPAQSAKAADQAPTKPSTIGIGVRVVRVGPWRLGQKRRILPNKTSTVRNPAGNDTGEGCVAPEAGFGALVDYYPGYRVAWNGDASHNERLTSVTTSRVGDRDPNGFAIGRATWHQVRDQYPGAKKVVLNDPSYGLGDRGLELSRTLFYESYEVLRYWFNSNGLLIGLETAQGGC